jgi:hypothetical protein
VDAASGSPRRLRGEPPLLDRVPLGDVDVGEHLDQRRDLHAGHEGQLGDVGHDAVDAQPDPVGPLVRLEVDVGRARANADQQQESEEVDGLALALLGGLLGCVHDGAAGAVELDVVLGERLVGHGAGEGLQGLIGVVGHSGGEGGLAGLGLGGLLDDGDEVIGGEHFLVLYDLGVAEGDEGGADLDDVAALENLGRDELSVDGCAVAGLEVADLPAVRGDLNHAVLATQQVVREDEIDADLASDGKLMARENQIPALISLSDLDIRLAHRSGYRTVKWANW